MTETKDIKLSFEKEKASYEEKHSKEHKYLFHLRVPAHFHLFKNIIKNFREKGYTVAIVVDRVEILLELLQREELHYSLIVPGKKSGSTLSRIWKMLKTDIKIYTFCIKFRPVLLIGNSWAITHVGKVLSIPSLIVNKFDYDIDPVHTRLSYPLSSHILTPSVCRTGKWSSKCTKYNGYHELAYLHPNVFTPDKYTALKYTKTKEDYFIVRLSRLKAELVEGPYDVSFYIADYILHLLRPYGKVFFVSDKPLDKEYEPHRINLNPRYFHHILAYATLFIGDSKTMAAEAAVLGTPFILFNEAAGKINYIEELESIYHLGTAINTNQAEKFYESIENTVTIRNLKEEWQNRRNQMLEEKIDVTKFMNWFIENYPQSITKMKEQPDFPENL